jgi:serine/threonine protein kinase
MRSWKVVGPLGTGVFGTVWEIELEQVGGQEELGGQERLALKDLTNQPSNLFKQEKETGAIVADRFPPIWVHSTAMVKFENELENNPYDDEGLKKRFEKFIITKPVAVPGPLKRVLDLRSPWSPEDLKRIMGCLVIGLAIMHEAGIRHHDIHTENILINGKVPLYNDYGLAKHDAFSYDLGGELHDNLHKRTFSFSEGISSSNIARLQPRLVALDIENTPNLWPDRSYNREKLGPERDILFLAGVLVEILAVLTGDKVLIACREIRKSRSVKYVDLNRNSTVREALIRHSIRGSYAVFAFLVTQMLEINLKFRIRAENAALDLFEQEGSSSMCDHCSDWCKKKQEKYESTRMRKKSF